MSYIDTNMPQLTALTEAYKYASNHCHGAAFTTDTGFVRLEKDLYDGYPHIARTAKVLCDVGLTELAACYMLAGPPPLDVRGSGSDYERTRHIEQTRKVGRDQASIISKLQGRAARTGITESADVNLRRVLMAEGIERLESVTKQCRNEKPGATVSARARFNAYNHITVQIPMADVLVQAMEQTDKIVKFAGSTGNTQLEQKYTNALTDAAKQLLQQRPVAVQAAQAAVEKKVAFASAAERQRAMIRALPFEERYNFFHPRDWREPEKADMHLKPGEDRTGLSATRWKQLLEREAAKRDVEKKNRGPKR